MHKPHIETGRLQDITVLAVWALGKGMLTVKSNKATDMRQVFSTAAGDPHPPASVLLDAHPGGCHVQEIQNQNRRDVGICGPEGSCPAPRGSVSASKAISMSRVARVGNVHVVS
jgi:hypothetical protein